LLELRERGDPGAAQPRLQAAIQAGLLPRPPDGQVPGRPIRNGSRARKRRRKSRGAPPRSWHRGPDRGRHALRHADPHGGQSPLVKVLRQEHRAQIRKDRDVHAEADLPGQRLRDAHAPEPLEEREEPVLRPEGLRRAVTPGPALHRRDPAPRAGALRADRAYDQQLTPARAPPRSPTQTPLQPSPPPPPPPPPPP